MNELWEQYGFLAVVIALIIIISSPVWHWRLISSAHHFDVQIVNDSVNHPMPFKHHRSLAWALNHLRIIPQNGQPYRESSSYTGSIINPRFTHSPINETIEGRDCVYIADKYGIDKSQDRKKVEQEKTNGGVTIKEAGILAKFAEDKSKTLIGEYWLLGHPTSAAARSSLEGTFGISWSGWTGKAYPDLATAIDDIIWLKSRYKSLNGKDWNFTGPGLLLTNKGRQILVLTKDQVEFPPLLIKPEGQLSSNGAILSPFWGWFEMCRPVVGAETHADFQIKTKEEGAAILSANALPELFPAIFNYRENRWYFAGDFARTDINTHPPYSMSFGPKIVGNIAKIMNKPHQGQFFNLFYIPMLKWILDEGHQRAKNKG